MLIRKSCKADLQKLLNIHSQAFETDTETKLVEKILESDTPFISLIAENQGIIAGHILLSKMSASDDMSGNIFGLAPMAVLPEYQKSGIGKQLIHASIDIAKEIKCDAIFVLGHPNYYPKFGFISTATYNIQSEYDVPDEVFMVLELNNSGLQSLSGKTVYYCESFQGL